MRCNCSRFCIIRLLAKINHRKSDAVKFPCVPSPQYSITAGDCGTWFAKSAANESIAALLGSQFSFGLARELGSSLLSHLNKRCRNEGSVIPSGGHHVPQDEVRAVGGDASDRRLPDSRR